MPVVTLLTGETVDSSAPEWRDECLRRHHHVLNMRRLSLPRRRDYLDNVLRREGAEAERRLRDEFARDWERRKEEARRGVANW